MPLRHICVWCACSRPHLSTGLCVVFLHGQWKGRQCRFWVISDLLVYKSTVFLNWFQDEDKRVPTIRLLGNRNTLIPFSWFKPKYLSTILWCNFCKRSSANRHSRPYHWSWHLMSSSSAILREWQIFPPHPSQFRATSSPANATRIKMSANTGYGAILKWHLHNFWGFAPLPSLSAFWPDS